MDFNPRSPSGLRLVEDVLKELLQAISIHAARVGCDYVDIANYKREKISIHAARVGCDIYAKSNKL